MRKDPRGGVQSAPHNDRAQTWAERLPGGPAPIVV